MQARRLPTMTRTRFFALLSLLGFAQGQTTFNDLSDPGNCPSFDIRYQNLMAKQQVGSILFVAHSPSFDLFTLGEAPSDGIRELAREGTVQGLIEQLETESAQQFICGYVAKDARLLPSLSSTVKLYTHNSNACSCSNMVISAVGKTLFTNDGFIALNKEKPSLTDPSAYWSSMYDAAISENTQVCSDIPEAPNNAGLYCTPPFQGAHAGASSVETSIGVHRHAGWRIVPLAAEEPAGQIFLKDRKWGWSDSGQVLFRFTPPVLASTTTTSTSSNWLFSWLFGGGFLG